MSKKAWTDKGCTDRRCLTGDPCRAAEIKGRAIVCKALENPHWPDGICKFYKTGLQYAEEYTRTNKLSKDPYEGGGTT